MTGILFNERGARLIGGVVVDDVDVAEACAPLATRLGLQCGQASGRRGRGPSARGHSTDDTLRQIAFALFARLNEQRLVMKKVVVVAQMDAREWKECK